MLACAHSSITRPTISSSKRCASNRRIIVCASSSSSREEVNANTPKLSNRRSLMLNSTAFPVFLGVLFDVGSKAPAPKLGVQEFNGIKSLTLCPPESLNCLSTAEEMGASVCFWSFSCYFVANVGYLASPRRRELLFCHNSLLTLDNYTDSFFFSNASNTTQVKRKRTRPRGRSTLPNRFAS